MTEQNMNSPERPQWHSKMIIYQIMVDRFRNGDPENDPRLEDTRGAYPQKMPENWNTASFSADWYGRQGYEKDCDLSIGDALQLRRYGGDLQGIKDQIPYLRSLGINALYLNPVFMAPSLHKYDAVGYNHIDPNFGPNPGGDKEMMANENPADPSTWHWTSADLMMLDLIEELDKNGIRVIFDGVFNHLGQTSPLFQDVLLRGENSPYASWFKIERHAVPEKGVTAKYTGWAGVLELPQLSQDENGMAEGPKEYIKKCTERWMAPVVDGKPRKGIDGWRLDVAYCVKHPFWKEWATFARRINPEVFLSGEVFNPKNGDMPSIDDLKPFLADDEFNSVMNYNLLVLLNNAFVEDDVMSLSSFNQEAAKLRENLPREAVYSMMNHLESHDTARMLTNIINRKTLSMQHWFEYCHSSKAENGQVDTRKPTEDEISIFKQLVLFQMTYVGNPLIYYGSEVGMWGTNDPDCRKPMLWEDIKYDDQVHLPDGTPRNLPDTVEPNFELLNYYKKLIEIRKSSEALQTGAYETLLIDDQKRIFAFKRSSANEEIIVVLNRSGNEQSIALELPPGEYKDLLNDRIGLPQLRLAAGQGAVLRREYTPRSLNSRF